MTQIRYFGPLLTVPHESELTRFRDNRVSWHWQSRSIMHLVLWCGLPLRAVPQHSLTWKCLVFLLCLRTAPRGLSLILMSKPSIASWKGLWGSKSEMNCRCSNRTPVINLEFCSLTSTTSSISQFKMSS